MKDLLRVLLISLLLLSCSQKGKGFIRTDGPRLVNHHGEVFQIRAINLGNWLLPEGYMWYLEGEKADRPRRIEARIEQLIGQEKAEQFWRQYRKNYIGRQDIKMIAEAGFNTVRLPVNYRILMDEHEDARFKRSGFRHINRLLRWCRRYGLYVVIDLHAAPGGQTGRNIDDSANDLPELFIEKKYRRQTIALWREMARRYKYNRSVLAYDLLNEPLPGDTAWMYHNQLEDLYMEISNAIRQEDPYHIITIEGANWGNDWSSFSAPFDDNLLYQFHKYWDEPTEESIRPYLQFRDLYQVPIWCGETGENSNEWYSQAFSLFEAHHIGWGFWPWKKIGRDNNPVTVIWPDGWNDFRNYMQEGGMLSQEEGEQILTGFLEDIRLENCTVNNDVLKALFPED